MAIHFKLGPQNAGLMHPSAMQIKGWFDRAQALHQAGRLEEAQKLYQQVLKSDPRHAGALHLLGLLAYQSHRPDVAADLIRQSLAVQPRDPAPHVNLGLALQDLAQWDEALASLDRALALQPRMPEAHVNRGIVLNELGRYADAVASYDRALALRSDMAAAHNNRGNALQKLGRLEDALMAYEEALRRAPQYPEALKGQGRVLLSLERPAQALDSLDRLLALASEDPQGHFLRGNALLKLGRLDEAVAAYDRSLVIDPNSHEVAANRGVALRRAMRFPEALASFDQALSLHPGCVQAYCGRGDLHMEQGYPEEALKQFDAGLAAEPGFLEAHLGRAFALQQLKRHEEARALLEAVVNRHPDCDQELVGFYLRAKTAVCDWSGLAPWVERVMDRCSTDAKGIAPFVGLAIFDDPMLLKQVATVYGNTRHPSWPWIGGPSVPERGARLTVGYYSADFRNHPVAFLTVGLLEAHDREAIEVVGFSFGPPTQDPMRQRIAAACDHFLDVSDLSDAEVAARSREIGIDIAIDLGGYTQHARTGIFAHRCAPVQVNYLGYPGTMGVDYMDYIIADATIVPAGQEDAYSEKIVRLPHSHLVYADPPPAPQGDINRADCGLPEDAVVYCCFNNAYKILPPVFERWMNILQAVPDSVLWLSQATPAVATNLRREAQQRGVDPSRLIFAERAPRELYVARYRLADLFLDTLPYNAGTTAADALWAGLPVLTCAGRSFASRMAAGLVNTAGLPELITDSLEAYEAKAIELGRDKGQLQAFGQRLAQGHADNPLFDIPRFARGLEAAYREMGERARAGLHPDHISVV